MLLTRPNLVLTTALLTVAATLRADIIADALFTFPAQTEYVEYDNLTSLRTLPNYDTLRQNFAGTSQEEAKLVLAQLGIPEREVTEVITASSTGGFYGLLTGQFSTASVSKSPKNKRYATKLLDTQIFCAGRQTCILFLEESLAAFGSVDQLKSMLLARQGSLTRLSSNIDVAHLLNGTDRSAPVRGILIGEQLNTGISKMIGDWSGWNIDRSRLPAIKGLAYSAAFDSKAHVSANVQCGSAAAAAMLSQALNAVSTMQSVTVPLLNASAGPPFQNMQVSSTGNMLYLKADSAIPAATPGSR